MTTSVPKQLVTVQLGSSLVARYTVPSNRTLVITKVTLLNSTGTDRTVTLHTVRSGDSADGTNYILNGKVCEANMTEPHIVAGAERHILEGGGTIQANADAAAAVTMVVSGVLLTTSSS